jgi:beta-lactamase regulating signal transducer with metallopeptidase domain/ankyrin repeat protein
VIAPFLQELERVFGWLLAASWQASVLALFVLLIQRVLGSRLNPRWRYALWLLVVLRLILPAVPESALSLFQFAPPPPAALTVSVSKPLFVSAPAVALPEVRIELAEPGHSFSIYSLLAIVWLVGALTLLVLTWQVNRRFARQIADSPAMTDPELWKLFDEAKAELGIRRSIRVVESAQVQSPAIMGLFQPTLLLPTDVRAKFDEIELRFIFLHELAHLKRGDVAVQALIALLQILHWFNPVLWFAFRRMRIDREPATDALVLSRTGEQEKERYGLMLIKLLEHFNQRHSLPTLVGILEDKDQFKRRFSLIARFTRGAYGWSLLGVIVIGALAIAGLTKGHRSTFVLDPTLPQELDLKPVYTKVFQPDGSNSTYRGFAGRKIIDGLPFDVGGESVLFGKGNAENNRDYPESFTIPIGHTFDELHLIHAAQWRDYYGCPVAVLRFHYADGTSYDFPIRFDFQVNDWSRLYTEDEEIVADPDTKIIWRGPGGAEGLGRLFKSVVRNPFPAKKIDSLEAIAAGHNASYTLVAATIAQSDPQREVTAGMPLVPARHFDGTLNVIVLDRKTGAPIAGAEVYPAMSIGDISLVADTVLTSANGVAPIKYPKDGTKDLRVEVAKDGYLTCDDNWNTGWQAGSMPPDVTYLLTPGRDPALDARRVTGHWKLASGTPAGFDIRQVNLYLGPKMTPPPFPPEAAAPDKRRQWFQDWLKTDAGKQFIAERQLTRLMQLKADGTFSGESVAPGEYILIGRISINGIEVLVNPRAVVIPKNSGTDPNAPVDIGEIELQAMDSSATSMTVLVKRVPAQIPAAAGDLNIRNPKPVTEGDPLKQELNFGANQRPNTVGTTLVKPIRNPAFDQTLINVARDGRTDKVGKGDAFRIGQLIADGADPNAKDNYEHVSALEWTLNFGKDDAAQVLIANGADAGAVDARGQNAAWTAAGIYFCPGALEMMIKKGIDLKSPDKKGDTIFSAMLIAPAAAAGKMNYLNDRAWTDAEFHAWQEREHRTMELLLSAGADINGRSGPESETALMIAAKRGNAEMTRELLAHGADVSLKDTNGETAAALAQMHGHPEILPLLNATPASPAPSSTSPPAK